jgi:hypothetical protein
MMSAHEMDAMGADAKIRAILAREHMRADRAVSASPDRIRQRPRRGRPVAIYFRKCLKTETGLLSHPPNG